MRAKVTEHDLELIRPIVIDYYKRSGHEHANLFIDELKAAPAWIDPDGVPRLGNWEIEDRKNRVALVRHPPMSDYQVYFGVYLKRNESEWTCGEDWHEIVRMRQSQ